MDNRTKFAIVSAALLTIGCTGTDRTSPGTRLGRYRVSATLSRTSCASASPPISPWVFDIVLTREQSTLYWVQNRAPVAGALDSSGKATLKSSTTVDLAGGSDAAAACVVERSDVLEATLVDPQSARPPAMSGVLGYTYRPLGDTRACVERLRELGAQDGPCEVVYDLSAERIAD